MVSSFGRFLVGEVPLSGHAGSSRTVEKSEMGVQELRGFKFMSGLDVRQPN